MKWNATESRRNGQAAAGTVIAWQSDVAARVRLSVMLVILATGLLAVVVLFRDQPAKGPADIATAVIKRSETPVHSEPPQERPPTVHELELGNKAKPFARPVWEDPRSPKITIAPESPLSIPDHWGIEITRIQIGLGGKALNVRYKVTDVNKATSLLYLTNVMYVFNHSKTNVLMVPFQRESQTTQKLVEGRTYFALLPNKGERVQSGNTVSVVLGGSRAANLVVE